MCPETTLCVSLAAIIIVTTTTTVLRPFVWDYPVEPLPEEPFTHLPTILIIIQPLSASSIYHGL